tara:strand:- start:99 stop:467 length:369 start_codon:yes stop_codon:yes gene_type:complete
MTFQYRPEWYHHPIPCGDGKISVLDPTIVVPAPEGHPDYGKTGIEVTGADIFTPALVAEYKEKNTWAQMREYRNKELVNSDWSQGNDVPDSIKIPYQTYRQKLREIGDAATTADVVWPTKPS